MLQRIALTASVVFTVTILLTSVAFGQQEAIIGLGLDLLEETNVIDTVDDLFGNIGEDVGDLFGSGENAVSDWLQGGADTRIGALDVGLYNTVNRKIDAHDKSTVDIGVVSLNDVRITGTMEVYADNDVQKIDARDKSEILIGGAYLDNYEGDDVDIFTVNKVKADITAKNKSKVRIGVVLN